MIYAKLYIVIGVIVAFYFNRIVWTDEFISERLSEFTGIFSHWFIKAIIFVKDVFGWPISIIVYFIDLYNDSKNIE